MKNKVAVCIVVWTVVGFVIGLLMPMPSCLMSAQPVEKAPIAAPSSNDFQEVVLPGRGTFLRYTGPGQLIWLTANEPIESKGLIETPAKKKADEKTK